MSDPQHVARTAAAAVVVPHKNTYGSHEELPSSHTTWYSPLFLDLTLRWLVIDFTKKSWLASGLGRFFLGDGLL